MRVSVKKTYSTYQHYVFKNYNRRCVPKIMLQTNKMNWVVSFKHVIQIKYEIDYKIILITYKFLE